MKKYLLVSLIAALSLLAGCGTPAASVSQAPRKQFLLLSNQYSLPSHQQHLKSYPQRKNQRLRVHKILQKYQTVFWISQQWL